MHDCGIYKIKNIVNGKFYIGSSTELKRRERTHFKLLKDGRHINPKLQNSYNKYGESNFVFEVVEYIKNPQDSLKIEQKWIDNTKSYLDSVGFNIMKYTSGGSSRGTGNYRSKKVYQIDKNSLDIINVFDSVNEIYRLLSYDVGNISRTCNKIKKENVWKVNYGYYWCYIEDYKNINIKIDYKNPQHKKIMQIDPVTLKVLKKWENIKIAEVSLNKSIGNISPVCKLVERENVWRQSYGFYWCYESDFYKIEFMTPFESKVSSVSVVQLTRDDELIGKYNTLKLAYDSTGVSASNISHVLRKRSKTAGGFKWMYKEDYDKLISSNQTTAI